MQELPTPVVLLKFALRTMPPGLLRPALSVVMDTMRRQHAPLFRRLTRLAPATIVFDPIDTPHCFLLTIAAQDIRLDLAPANQAASARISGTLANLLNLLEGRIDSDTLFFSRDVTISGDTGVSVGFRNTLDGEAIGLVNDALRLAGPLADPMRRLALRVDCGISRMRQAAADWHAAQHRGAAGGRDLAADHDALAAEVALLRDRVATLAATMRRRQGVEA